MCLLIHHPILDLGSDVNSRNVAKQNACCLKKERNKDTISSFAAGFVFKNYTFSLIYTHVFLVKTVCP